MHRVDSRFLGLVLDLWAGGWGSSHLRDEGGGVRSREDEGGWDMSRRLWIGGCGSSHPSALGSVREGGCGLVLGVSLGLEVGAAAIRQHSGV